MLIKDKRDIKRSDSKSEVSIRGKSISSAMLKHSLLLSADSPDYLSPLGDKSTGETAG